MADITQLHEIDLGSGQITKMRWSPGGRLLALPTQSGRVMIFDIETQQVIQTVGPHSGWVTAVAWNLKGEFIMTGSRDRSIGLWELKSGRRAPFTFQGHRTTVHSIEWTDEDAYAMTCSLDRVRALDGFCLLSGWTKEMEDRVNKRANFTAASCSRQSTFLLGIAAENGTRLNLISLLWATLLSTVRMAQPVRTLAWSPVEDVLSVGTNQSILLFRATQEGFVGRPHQLGGHMAQVYALAFSSDGSLLASRDDQGLRFWDVKGAKLIAALREYVGKSSSKRPSSGIAFHPTRPLLATVAPGGTAFRILDVSKLV